MTVTDFLSGAITFGFALAGLYFLRFWRRTHDGLFLTFAVAFVLMGLGQGVQALANVPEEERHFLFLFRLAAFGLILAAIVRKNRRAT